MGRDKALLPVGGETLLERQMRLAREAGARTLYLSCRNAGDYPLPGAVALPDRQADGGPLEGIAAALEATRAERLLVLAVDLPAMNGAFLGWLAAHPSPGVVPLLRGGSEPLAALYPAAAAGLARELLARNRRSARAFAAAACEAGWCVASAVPEAFAGALANWNRPGDWSGPLT